MGRKSKIEAHPQSEEIIKRLASGEEYSKIVEDFPDIRYQDLDYYKENKLPQILSKSNELKELVEQIESADIHKGDTYLQLVIGLQKKALDALELQDPKGDPKSWTMEGFDLVSVDKALNSCINIFNIYSRFLA
jgi:hypothetical protein